MTKAQRLTRMKALATGLLVLAAGLYGLAMVMQQRAPAWAGVWTAVAAFAEAAMIGAMADWFAVVALFRHPLGLPIPHTAIVPRNQARIGENLAAFICDHFLGTTQVVERLRAFDPARRLAQWMADPAHARQASELVTGAGRHVLTALEDPRVAAFVREAVLRRMAGIEIATWAGRLLAVLTEGRRHQALLDEVLQRVAARLEDEALQAEIAERIAAEVQVLRMVGLDLVAGRMGTRKLVAGLGRLIAEMGEDTAHPLRARFDGFVARLVDDLQHDPAMRLKAETLRADVLAHPALADYVQQLWQQAVEALRRDLHADDGVIRTRLADAVQALGERLSADTAMQDWLNGQWLQAAPGLVARWREDIRRHITERVARWPADELSRELELHIGPDLQYVRLNGTLVGGLIGLLIHAVTHTLMP